MDGERKNPVYKTIAIIFTFVILAAVTVLLIVLFSSTSNEPEAVLGDDAVQFTGMYGQTYAYADITGVTLEDSIPAIGEKTDGSGLGEVKKGDWEVDGLGKCRLFVMSASGPFIVMNTKSGYVIINYKDAEKTKALYGNILGKLA